MSGGAQNKTGIYIPGKQNTGIDLDHAKLQLDYKRDSDKNKLELNAKLIDHLFSAHFLVFIVTLFVIASGFLYMRMDGLQKGDILDYWKIIIPVITTYIGYAIGRGRQRET